MSMSAYSATAASNTAINGLSIAEGCPPGNLNNMGREIMADLASDAMRLSGTQVITGNKTFTGTLDAANNLKVGATGANGRVTFKRSSNGADMAAIYWGADSGTGPFTMENANGGDLLFISARTEGGLLSTTYSTTTNFNSLLVYAAGNDSYNAGASAAKLGSNSVTGYSLRTSGLIGASGADFAEYMTKALGTGPNAKGAIVGIDDDGLLTDVFADAHSFAIKSTSPAYVGNDTWGAEAGAAPIEPVLRVPTFDGPDEPEPLAPFEMECPALPGDAPSAPIKPTRIFAEGDIEWAERVNAYVIAHASWKAACARHAAYVKAYPKLNKAYDDALAAYEPRAAAYNETLTAHRAAAAIFAERLAAAQADHAAALAAHAIEHGAWSQAYEALRQTVDRIAFSGQVPVNVLGATPGQFIVATHDGDGITGVPMWPADMDDEDRLRAVGKVWKILPDGRAWVKVL